MSAAGTGDNRREADRRLERVEARQTQIGEDVAVLKSGLSGVEEDVRRVMPVVLEQSELRSEIKSLIRGDKRLEQQVADLKRQLEDGDKARESARQEAADRASDAESTRKRERWRQWGAVAVAFILATGTVVAAVIASAPHPP